MSYDRAFCYSEFMSNEDFYNFMNEKILAVISTLSADGTPQAAVVGFGQTKDLEIVFGTNKSSRKYANITRDSHVAFVIGWENGETIQYEGIARELSSDELEIVRESYWKKNPRAEANYKEPSERHFIVKPTWIRYTNLKSEPWDIAELKF